MTAFASRSRSFCLSVAGVASIVALAGCATEEPPSLAERIAAAGAAHAELAAHVDGATVRKNQAEDDLRAAKKAIKKAQKALDQANKDLLEAEERVIETRRELAEAEAEAHRRGFTPTPKPES